MADQGRSEFQLRGEVSKSICPSSTAQSPYVFNFAVVRHLTGLLNIPFTHSFLRHSLLYYHLNSHFTLPNHHSTHVLLRQFPCIGEEAVYLWLGICEADFAAYVRATGSEEEDNTQYI